MTDRTDAEQLIYKTLDELLAPATPYRVGVLLLSYPSPDPEDDCRIAQAVAMKSVDFATALDTVIMVRSLRDLADRLEKTVKGELPPPSQEGLPRR